MPLRTFKGTYISINKFAIDEDNTIISVYPYSIIADKYEDKYPFDCYIQIDENNTVKNIVEV